jgi:hypothetical protein
VTVGDDFGGKSSSDRLALSHLSAYHNSSNQPNETVVARKVLEGFEGEQ